MSVQPLLPFAAVPITDPTQARYHAIAPCLAGKLEPQQQARLLNRSYSTVSRWLKQFRAAGMRGLFPASVPQREPYTPERIIVSLIYFKCCVPLPSDRELARVIGNLTGHKLHNETVKSLLERYFFWQYREFHSRIVYPSFPDATAKRREIIKLDNQDWSNDPIAALVHCSRSREQKKPGEAIWINSIVIRACTVQAAEMLFRMRESPPAFLLSNGDLPALNKL